MNDEKNIRIRDPLLAALIRRVSLSNEASDSSENRTRIGMLAGWLSSSLSLLLCAVKGWLGIVSGSVSLVADATNNLADVGSSLVVALGFHWSRKPRDENHPFGHGRIEAVATLVLSIALLLVGIEVGRSGIIRLLAPHPVSSSWPVLIGVGITVIVKLWMAYASRVMAKMTGSHVLDADAWNHAYDVICTLLVVVALVCSRFGWNSVDGWAAIAVSAFIVVTGVQFAREAIDILLGKPPAAGEVRKIRKAVETVDGVQGVHEIMVHQYGDIRMVSFHIEVDAGLSLVDAHEISEEAEHVVERELEWRALAHVDPVDRSHPCFLQIHKVLSAFVESDEQLVDFHDLRVQGDQPPYQISFDLVVGLSVCCDLYGPIYSRSAEFIASNFLEKVGLVEVGVEASVDSSPMCREKFYFS